MFTVTCSVAAGTIFESRYNTDFARLVVYHTWWFRFLLVLLFTNIFCATISRYPFKKHHIGFIITHIGLLTLLTGSLMTNNWGIDGQLRIDEGTQGDMVALPELVFEIINKKTDSLQSFPVERGLSPLNFEQLKGLNEKLAGRVSIVSYIPYAGVERVFKSEENPGGDGPIAVSFRLKSAFFDVNEWLNSKENPDFQMGPAHFTLVSHDKAEKIPETGELLAVEHAARPKIGHKKKDPVADRSKGREIGSRGHAVLKILSSKNKSVQKIVSILATLILKYFTSCYWRGNKLGVKYI